MRSRRRSLLGEVRELQVRALGILAKAEEAGDLRAATGAIREARSTIELLAKLTGEARRARRDQRRPYAPVADDPRGDPRSVGAVSRRTRGGWRAVASGRSGRMNLAVDLAAALDPVAARTRLGATPLEPWLSQRASLWLSAPASRFHRTSSSSIA